MSIAPWMVLASLVSSQTIATYRVQNRPADDLVSVAEAALGNAGSVTLDARTATLILNGPEDAVERALALLKQMDRPLRDVLVTHEIRELAELEGLSVDIRWQVGTGRLRIGTLPLPVDGVRIALAGGTESRKARSRSVLRLLEGGSGAIVTGDLLPFVYQPYPGVQDVAFVAAETGFEATVSITGPSGDEKVHLDLRPFSGRMEGGGGLRYTAAVTSATISPGETVVIGEASREASARSADFQGAATSRAHEERVLLVSVVIE
ncbi:MAG TPA: secretin N-terminal domain-containing protein [Vicinamibacteria bacterium]|nr:secretin N-terminal domain-containing protein [Vicinamibacteria bacterium]